MLFYKLFLVHWIVFLDFLDGGCAYELSCWCSRVAVYLRCGLGSVSLTLKPLSGYSYRLVNLVDLGQIMTHIRAYITTPVHIILLKFPKYSNSKIQVNNFNLIPKITKIKYSNVYYKNIMKTALFKLISNCVLIKLHYIFICFWTWDVVWRWIRCLNRQWRRLGWECGGMLGCLGFKLRGFIM